MSRKAHIVLIADQVDSRRSPDAVPRALELLNEIDVVLPFERTAGDELQGLVADGATAIGAVMRLWSLGSWSIGLGVGDVESPLPQSTREARGSAYVAARRAIEEASETEARLRVVCAGDPDGYALTSGADDDPQEADVNQRARRESDDPGYQAETVLHLMEPIVRGRTSAVWEALELADAGLSQSEIGVELGISQSAVSRRLARALATEVGRGSDLAARLLEIARCSWRERGGA